MRRASSGGGPTGRLRVIGAGSTLLSGFGGGDGRPLRLDGGTGSRDTGVMLSVVYCAGGGRVAGDDARRPCLMLARPDAGAGARPVELEMVPDRIVVFRSRMVGNGLKPLPAGVAAPLYLVTVLVHGMPDAF